MGPRASQRSPVAAGFVRVRLDVLRDGGKRLGNPPARADKPRPPPLPNAGETWRAGERLWGGSPPLATPLATHSVESRPLRPTQSPPQGLRPDAGPETLAPGASRTGLRHPTSLSCLPRGCSDVEGDRTSKLSYWALWHPWARQPAFDPDRCWTHLARFAGRGSGAARQGLHRATRAGPRVASPGCRAWKPRRARPEPCRPTGSAGRERMRRKQGLRGRTGDELEGFSARGPPSLGHTRSSHDVKRLPQTCGPRTLPLSRCTAGTRAGPLEQGCWGAGGRASLPFPTGQVPARTPESGSRQARRSTDGNL